MRRSGSMHLASRLAAAFGVLALSTLACACGSSGSASDPSTDDDSDGSASVAPEGGSDAGDAGTSSDATPGDANVPLDSGHDDANVSVDSGHGDGSTTDGAPSLPPTTTCAMSAACGNSGQDFQLCTTSSGNTCDSVEYETSDGTTVACASCDDCSAAFDDVLGYCSSLVLTCGDENLCGSSGGYSEMCTDSLNGVCTYAWYGAIATYPCASCSDCSAAATEVMNYCNGM
jgi:hypothetical protein